MRLIAIVLAVAACTGAPAASPSPSFDIARVIASFADECRDPIVVDETFCEQVRISTMTARGDTLIVPTTLNAAADARAEAICDQLTVAHFDANGQDLGYKRVEVLDMEGDGAASCSI